MPKFDVISEPSLTLNYNLNYISKSYKTMLGSPIGTSQSNNFSQFIANYSVKPIFFSIRGIESWINAQLPGGEDEIEIPAMILFLALSMMVFIFTLYGQKSELFAKSSSYWWFLQLLVILFILLFSEFAISQALFDLKYSDWGRGNLDSINSMMKYINSIIAILWWIVPAYYVTSAFEQFLWNPIKRKTGAEVPNVLRLFVTIVVYVLAFMGIMAFVLEVTITSLAATSGVLAIFFAIVSKIDLSNIIAGLGISFAKIFKLGDWVKIGDIEGQVVEMTPRSTKVLTFDSTIINIPNTTVSSAIIENYTHPVKAVKLVIRLEIVPLYRFEDVEKVLLDAVISTPDVLDTPSPVVLFHGQGDSSQIFEIAFFIDDYSRKALLWEATWRRIWRHLEQADIILATPQREVFLPKEVVSDIAAPLTLINNSGAFEAYSKEEKEILSQSLIEENYEAGDIILEKDAKNAYSYIIREGVVAFIDEEKNEFKRLGSAEVFSKENMPNIKIIAKTATKLFAFKNEKKI
jgi:branched-chain amino acid transport system substrate-binding protein